MLNMAVIENILYKSNPISVISTFAVIDYGWVLRDHVFILMSAIHYVTMYVGVAKGFFNILVTIFSIPNCLMMEKHVNDWPPMQYIWEWWNVHATPTDFRIDKILELRMVTTTGKVVHLDKMEGNPVSSTMMKKCSWNRYLLNDS